MCLTERSKICTCDKSGCLYEQIMEGLNKVSGTYALCGRKLEAGQRRSHKTNRHPNSPEKHKPESE